VKTVKGLSDMTGFKSFHSSTCKRVPGDLTLNRKVV